MACYLVKVEYGQNRFTSFMIEDISLAALVLQITKNCSTLAHLHSSNVRLRYRDEDGDMVNLTDDGFSISEMLRSAKEVKDRDFKKIFIQANEIDSPVTKKARQINSEAPSCSNVACLKPKYLSYGSPTFPHGQVTPVNTSTSQAKRNSPLDTQKLEMEDNLQVLSIQISSAKTELEKLNRESKSYLLLRDVRGRLCTNCHGSGHTKTKCSNSPCTNINACKITEKHPEFKSKITELQRQIKKLETQFLEEETNLNSFTVARERASTSFFAVMRPRLKAQNLLKYSSGNRVRLDHDLLILQRALKKVPEWDESEDWQLPLIIEQYENSKVKIFMQNGDV